MKRFRLNISTQSGFTLIELMFVISIVSLLSSLILVSAVKAREKAQVTTVKANLEQFSKIVQIAQINTSNTLIAITGSGCSDCICRDGISKANVAVTSQCNLNWQNAIALINTASGASGSSVATAMARDPWRAPYGLDENEREAGPTDCRNDQIRSFGPDGIAWNADDIVLDIPWLRPCP